MAPRKGIAVLVASSAAADPTRGVHARTRADGPKLGDGDLVGTIVDIASVYAYLLSSLKVAIHKMFADVDPENVNSSKVMQALATAFSLGKDFVIVYYSGHGQQATGAWCFEEPGTRAYTFISCTDVTTCWRQRRNARAGQTLYLILDSCFSGHWTIGAHAEMDVIVQAACGEEGLAADTTEGGVWTKSWLRAVAEVADERDPERGLIMSGVVDSARIDEAAAVVACLGEGNSGVATELLSPTAMWRVVSASGGVAVRQGSSLKSQLLRAKLATGTLVREVEHQGERLRYTKASLGAGPDNGWISTRVNNSVLAEKTDRSPAVVLLFAPAASCFVGMLSAVQDHPVVKEVLREADSALCLDKSSLDLCLHGPQDHIRYMLTVVADVVGFRKLLHLDPEVSASRLVMAHYDPASLVAALCCASVMSFGEGLRLIKVMGEAIWKSNSAGGYCQVKVVGLMEETLLHVCAEAVRASGQDAICQITHFSFPLCYWVTVAESISEEFVRMCRSDPSASHVQLDYDQGTRHAGAYVPIGGSHTGAFAPFIPDIEAAIDRLLPTMQAPRCTVWVDTDVAPLESGCSVTDIARVLKRCLCAPMKFHQMIEGIINQEDVAEFYEVGPGTELTRLLKGIDPRASRACRSGGGV